MSKKTGTPGQKVVMGYRERQRQYRQRKHPFLSMKKFEKLEPDTIFATGETTDGYDTVNMYGKGQHLKWIAKTGGGNDWAIYIAPSDWSEDQIKATGDKVHDRESIKKLVPCDDAVLERYRD